LKQLSFEVRWDRKAEAYQGSRQHKVVQKVPLPFPIVLNLLIMRYKTLKLVNLCLCCTSPELYQLPAAGCLAWQQPEALSTARHVAGGAHMHVGKCMHMSLMNFCKQMFLRQMLC